MKKIIKSLLITAAFATAAMASQSESFGGLGISVWTSKSGVKVAGVIPNSPAESIGLQSGDLILSANGADLSAISQEMQIGFLRGEAGTSINLVIDRNGSQISLSTKRAQLSVQSLDASDISAWYGKSAGLTAEELSHLASQKVGEGYELLGVMQNGMPLVRSAENLSANAVQQISIKKAEVKMDLAQPDNIAPELNNKLLTNSSFVNVKGAQVKANERKPNAPVYRVR
ncbi:MAG: PDZ domain-containing protein [Fibromonadaceae bacterium]|jgi:membrane-associated protease RseP (regulator of RpoE activity)|nr:PDZ domain-containing protein [Fibromonadaceae bacterium]